MDGSTLDDILNGNDTAIAEAPAIEAVAEPSAIAAESEPAPTGPARDDKGRFAPKGDNEGSSPEPKNEPALDHPALLGERRRRQEAEDRLRDLEARFAQFENTPRQPAQPTAPELDDDLLFSNPREFVRIVTEQARQQAIAEARGLSTETAMTIRLDMSEQLARSRHADYEDKLTAFRDMARDNPNVIAEMQRQSDPAEWAYQKAASWSLLQEVGSIDALKDKLRAEILAEQPKPQPIIPETLADAPAARAPAGGVPLAPPSLDEILNGRR